ncbi:hypothetical protein GGR55DRAFT_671658, partial [Xylaria sp. FL0064]
MGDRQSCFSFLSRLLSPLLSLFVNTTYPVHYFPMIFQFCFFTTCHYLSLSLSLFNPPCLVYGGCTQSINDIMHYTSREAHDEASGLGLGRLTGLAGQTALLLSRPLSSRHRLV